MKANRPYKTVKGQTITLTDREIKAYIMRVNGWTEQEYNKQRYIMKNKLRTYEAFTGVPASQAQSPTNVLYFEAHAKADLSSRGTPYQPSPEMQRLRAFSGLGSASQIQKAMQSKKTRARLEAVYSTYTDKQFAGLIAKNAKAKEIAEKVTDPVKREKALAEYARYIKWQLKHQDDSIASQATPISFGEVVGSDTEFDEFDYSAYI